MEGIPLIVEKSSICICPGTLFNPLQAQESRADSVQALRNTFSAIAARTDNEFFALSCNSILMLMDRNPELTIEEMARLSSVYASFMDTSAEGCSAHLESYLQRQRAFVLAWRSPTDGEVSYSRLNVPRNWDPKKQQYPLYVRLHGYGTLTDNPIDYMSKYFANAPSTTTVFEDGYWLSPWGKGNLFFEGISETDIYECVAELECIVDIDPSHKYLCGHSMGGHGAWYIGHLSVDTWVALGIYAGPFAIMF